MNYTKKGLTVQLVYFFENMFSVGMRETQDSVISVQDISLPTFKKLLEFIYSDQLVKIENADQAIDVLVAANKYGLDWLKRLCESTSSVSLKLTMLLSYCTCQICIRQ